MNIQTYHIYKTSLSPVMGKAQLKLNKRERL